MRATILLCGLLWACGPDNGPGFLYDYAGRVIVVDVDLTVVYRGRGTDGHHG